MNINEVIRNPWLVVPANISKSGESNQIELACFVVVVNRDSNQDGSRPITINVNNTIHVHLPTPRANVQPNMTINHEHGYDDDNDDDEEKEEEEEDNSDGDGTSSGSSQRSIDYITPPSSGQPSQPKLPPTP